MNKTSLLKLVVVFSVSFSLTLSPAYAESLKTFAINSGGGTPTSSSFSLQASAIGDAAAGSISSASFKLDAGYAAQTIIIPAPIVTLSGGGGGGDKTPPSFTTTFSESDYPLRIAGIDYSLVSVDDIPTHTIETGQPIQVQVTVYENSGSKRVQHADMYVNQKGERILNDLTETVVTYDSGNLGLVDPFGLVSSVNAHSSILGIKTTFVFDVIFEKEIETSDILFRIWDMDRNAVYLHVPDVLQVITAEPSSDMIEIPSTDDFVEVPDVILDAEPIFSWGQFNEWAGYSSSSISDDKFLNHLEIEGDSIPKWFKNNNAKWVKDGLISQDVFVDALNNLSERGLL